MISSGKFKQYLTIPEAALVWEGASLDLLVGAAYVRPGVPVIVGHPDVTARAEALLEATEMGSLMECGRIDPDMRLPAPDQRIVAREALVAWIKEYWPNEMPGRVTIHPQPPMPAEVQPEDRLLNRGEVEKMLGIGRATLARRLKAGLVPKASHEHPQRWRLSVIQQCVKAAPQRNDV